MYTQINPHADTFFSWPVQWNCESVWMRTFSPLTAESLFVCVLGWGRGGCRLSLYIFPLLKCILLSSPPLLTSRPNSGIHDPSIHMWLSVFPLPPPLRGGGLSPRGTVFLMRPWLLCVRPVRTQNLYL